MKNLLLLSFLVLAGCQNERQFSMGNATDASVQLVNGDKCLVFISIYSYEKADIGVTARFQTPECIKKD